MLLGSLHVELSSGHRWNHPPLQQPAPPPVPVDRVEVSSVLPPNPKKDTQEPHTPVAVRAAICTRTDRREVPSGIQRDQWETPPIPGIEPPPSWQAPAALPLELLPSEGSQNSPQGATAQHTHPQHMQAPRRRPAFPPLVWLYVDLRKSQYPLGFLNPKDLNSPGPVAVAHKGDL